MHTWKHTTALTNPFNTDNRKIQIQNTQNENIMQSATSKNHLEYNL